MSAVEHGTLSAYTRRPHPCRCTDCRKAFAEYQQRRRARLRRVGLPVGDLRHGTTGGYTNYGCRCAQCSAAVVEYKQRRTAQR